MWHLRFGILFCYLTLVVFTTVVPIRLLFTLVFLKLSVYQCCQGNHWGLYTTAGLSLKKGNHRRELIILDFIRGLSVKDVLCLFPFYHISNTAERAYWSSYHHTCLLKVFRRQAMLGVTDNHGATQKNQIH